MFHEFTLPNRGKIGTPNLFVLTFRDIISMDWKCSMNCEFACLLTLFY